jgi:hypothetical protein
MLIAFCIKSTFWWTIYFLNGSKEDMETNYSSMPTSCNVDSGAMPSNTQDSLHGSELQADVGTLPITFKKNLMIV